MAAESATNKPAARWARRREEAQHPGPVHGPVADPHAGAGRGSVPGHAPPRGAGRELRPAVLHRADLHALARDDVDGRACQAHRAVGQHQLRLDRRVVPRYPHDRAPFARPGLLHGLQGQVASLGGADERGRARALRLLRLPAVGRDVRRAPRGGHARQRRHLRGGRLAGAQGADSSTGPGSWCAASSTRTTSCSCRPTRSRSRTRTAPWRACRRPCSGSAGSSRVGRRDAGQLRGRLRAPAARRAALQGEHRT